MNIANIESFLTLVKTKHFAKAADSLFISQPALSKRIKSLENEFGVPFFDRTGNKTYLTVQGEAFKSYAEEIFATYNRAKEHIKQIESMAFGTLNFGATNFIGVYMLPSIIAKYKKLYPNIKINMVIETSNTILDMMHKNQLEFVFLSDYINLESNQYVIEDYWKDRLVAIVGNEHRLFDKASCSLYDLKQDTYITKRKKSSQYKFLERIFRELDFDFPDKLFISTQDAIKEAVINNVGVSIISKLAVEREAALGLIKMLDIEDIEIERTIQCTYIKNKNLTPAANAFLELL